MKRRTLVVLSLAVAFLAIAVLTGCGGTEGNNEDNQDTAALFVLSSLDEDEAVPSVHASRSVISPDRQLAACIDPFEFEMIGEILLFQGDNNTATSKLTLNQEELPQFTPKQVSWYDNSHLLVVVGFAYGTVTRGGDLYLVDITDGSSQLVYKAADHEEVIEAELEGDHIKLSLAKFDQDYAEHEIEHKEIPLPQVE